MPAIEPLRPMPQSDILGDASKLISMKDAMQQIQQRTRANAQADAATKAFQSGGTDEETLKKLRDAGAIPQYMAWREHLSTMDSQALSQAKERAATVHEWIAQLHDTATDIGQADKSLRPTLWKNHRKWLLQSGIPEQMLPPDYDEDYLAQFKDAKKESEILNSSLETQIKRGTLKQQEQTLSADTARAGYAKTTEERAAAEEQRKKAGLEGFDSEERAFRQWLPSHLGSTPDYKIPQDQITGMDLSQQRLNLPSTVEASARDAYRASKQAPDDFDKYIAEKMSEGMTRGQAMDKYKTIAGTNTFNLNNPGSASDTVSKIADQMEPAFDPVLFTKLTNSDKTLQKQVTQEMLNREGQIHILTGSTKTTAETAHELMPSFDDAIKMLNDKDLASLLGPVGSRWQEFIAGKIGSSDPALRKATPETIAKMNRLRDFVNLLQSGAAKAHIGVRGAGSPGLQEKFERLFNADRMDATTLRDSLNATKDFFKRYESIAYKDKTPAATAPAATTNPYR